MAVDLEGIRTEENSGLSLQEIVNGDGTSSIEYLDEIREQSFPILDMISKNLSQSFGVKSEINRKNARTAIEKCARVATFREDYQWFSLSHIRDYLRFRTYVEKASDFSHIIERFVELQDAGVVSIVKLETEKLYRPGPFGWRMIAVDLRISDTGMLVEHYMTFREMIEVNETWLHRIYEKWRSISPGDMTREIASEFTRDRNFCKHAYRELLFDGWFRALPEKALPELRHATEQVILEALEATI